MVSVGDLDGNGVDDLVVGVKFGSDHPVDRVFLDENNYDFSAKSLVVLFLQPQHANPVMRATRLEGVGFDGMLGSLTPDTLINVGDIDNNGLPELLSVSEAGAKGTISYEVLSIKEYGEPVHANNVVQLSDYANYWASYNIQDIAGDKVGSVYRYKGQGVDLDPMHRFGVTLIKNQVRKLYNLGDLDGDGLPELGIPLMSLMSPPDIGSVLILSPRRSDFSETVAFPGIPILSNSSYRVARLRDTTPHSPVPKWPTEIHRQERGLLYKHQEGEFSRILMRRDDLEKPGHSHLVVVHLPYPLNPDSLPVMTWEEPQLLVFKPRYLFLDVITLILSVIGLILAAIVIYRWISARCVGLTSLATEGSVGQKGPLMMHIKSVVSEVNCLLFRLIPSSLSHHPQCSCSGICHLWYVIGALVECFCWDAQCHHRLQLRQRIQQAHALQSCHEVIWCSRVRLTGIT